MLFDFMLRIIQNKVADSEGVRPKMEACANRRYLVRFFVAPRR